MLQDIRNNAQGTIAKIIIGLLIVSLSIWGMDAIIGGFSGEPEVATVNGEDITEREFLRVVQMESQRRLSRMDRPDPTLLDEDQIRKEVLESLIQQELMSQDAANQGLALSDPDIDALITQMPQFQVDGAFNRDRFVATVRNMGMGVGEFRELLRSQYVVNQIRNGVVQSALVSQNNLNQLLRLQNQSRNFKTVTVSAQQVRDNIEVTDEQIESFYQDNQARFERPERVTARYLVLSLDSLTGDVEVAEEDVRALYEERATELVNEERRGAHILIEDGADADDTMETIQQRLADGEDFAALAEEFSVDTFSAEDGGDLGFSGRGVYEEAFEEALYQLEVGEVSEPVSTRFGVHLIKLLDTRQSEAPEFAEMQEQLRQELATQRAQNRFAEVRSELADSAYSADNLEEPAEKLGLEIRETQGVTRDGGQAPFDHAGLVRQLFSEDVLRDGYNTEVIDVEENMAVVASVGEYFEARVQPLEEVAATIREELEEQQLREALKEKARAVIAQLEQGEKLSDIEMVDSGWSAYQNQRRNNQSVSREVMGVVFSMPHPEDDQPVYESVYNGQDMVIVSLTAVNESDTESNDAEQQQLASFLTSVSGQQEYQAYQNYLRKNAEVERP